MSEDHWEGATWVFHADITNDGTNSGDHVYAVVPGGGNEMEILYGRVLNGDTSSRTIIVEIGSDSTPSEILALMVPTTSITAGSTIPFPTTDEFSNSSAVQGVSRWLIAGTMALFVQVAAVAINQDTAFSVVGRVRGGVPTATLTSPTDAVETVNVNQVF